MSQLLANLSASPAQPRRQSEPPAPTPAPEKQSLQNSQARRAAPLSRPPPLSRWLQSLCRPLQSLRSVAG